MFDTIIKDKKLPGYANPLTVVVAVQSLLLTEGNMKAEWTIRLPEAGAKLPGALPPSPLFGGTFDMPPPLAIMQGLGGYFQATAPALVAGLSLKADAAAKLIADQAEAAAKAIADRAVAAAQAELDRIAAQAVVPPAPTQGFVPPN
jgi:hypothetical protein